MHVTSNLRDSYRYFRVAPVFRISLAPVLALVWREKANDRGSMHRKASYLFGSRPWVFVRVLCVLRAYCPQAFTFRSGASEYFKDLTNKERWISCLPSLKYESNNWHLGINNPPSIQRGIQSLVLISLVLTFGVNHQDLVVG